MEDGGRATFLLGADSKIEARNWDHVTFSCQDPRPEGTGDRIGKLIRLISLSHCCEVTTLHRNGFFLVQL